MKSNKFLFAIAVASLSLVLSIFLASCSEDYDLSSSIQDSSESPIELQAFFSSDVLSLGLSESISVENPVKVAVFGNLECGSYTKLYEAEAYVDDNNNLVWLDGNHFWMPKNLMSFTIYYPADSYVKFDDYGRIVDGNCTLSGHSAPMNKNLQNRDNSILSYSISIVPFSSYSEK